MYYGNIKEYDIADGPGVRVTLFVSGCTNQCKGCFQKETWDFHYGKPYTEEVEDALLTALHKPYIKGLTLLGGEPFEKENQRELVKLLRRVRRELPQKDIWAYTGFLLDQDLCEGGKRFCDVTEEMLGMIDYLVDGRFEIDQKDIRLRFRGSRNQRIIDMKKTREYRQIILWDEA